MYSKRNLLLAVSALWLAAFPPLVRAAETPQDEGALLEVLKSDAQVFDKAKACQRLAVVGTKASIPVLAGLLTDEKLAHYARFGLEPIPDPAVDEVLRAALSRTKGLLRVGVIDSIGVRRDTEATSALVEILGGEDAVQAGAAAAALGRIATPETAKALTEALASSVETVRVAVADACLPCAERLVAEGQRQVGARLYDAVRSAEVPKHLQLAALRGALVTRKARAPQLLVRSLRSDDPAVANLALLVSREIKNRRVTKALVEELPNLSAEKQALVLLALGDRGDRAALSAVLEAAKEGPEEVRIAAIRALRGVGDASAIPVLLDAAARSEGAMAEAAQVTIANLQGAEVDGAIVALLEGDDKQLRPALIELIGRRRIRSSVPALRKALDDEDAAVRLAAIQALGATIGPEEITVLTARIIQPAREGESAAARDALQAACRRMPDRAACAGKLVESMGGASVEAKCLLLEVFPALEEEAAIDAVAASVGDSNAAIQGTAIRVLGDWPNEKAAFKLLELIQTDKNPKSRAASLQAFSSVVRRIGFPKEQRLGVCVRAMELSASADEKKIVIGALAGIPAPETLEILGRYLESAELKESASSAMVTICERLIRSKRDAVPPAMKKVMEASSNERLTKKAKDLFLQAGGKL